MLRLSHKARLSGNAACAVAVLMAIILVSIFHLIRGHEIWERRRQLEECFATGMRDPDERFDIKEVRESYPEVSIAIFRNGLVQYSHGKIAPPILDGFQIQGDVLFLGGPFLQNQVVLARDWHDTRRSLAVIEWVFAGLWVLMVVLVGAVTWLSANAVFRPLTRLSEQASAINGSRLAERLSTQDTAEFGLFASQLNAMLERIHQTLQREEQFAADAAHEMRTPLALMRTRIETTLLADRSSSEYRSALHKLLQELDRLTLIGESLLWSMRTPGTLVDPIELEPVVVDILEVWQARYQDLGLHLDLDLKPARGRIDPDELRVILDNLLDNARRFSPAGATVTVILASNQTESELRVQDEGPGVPSEMIEQIFDRFFRVDHARNREAGGVGIGLAVCRRVLEARGGTISAVNAPLSGLIVLCRIPS